MHKEKNVKSHCQDNLHIFLPTNEIDIVVRHVAVSPSSVQQTDKFRIQIFDEASPDEVVGKRDVLATLHPGGPCINQLSQS